MAPLSNAERQKRYRERLKLNNPEKYEEKRKAHLQKVKQNKKKQSELNEHEKEKQRKQWRKYSTKYYSKQRKVNNSASASTSKVSSIKKKELAKKKEKVVVLSDVKLTEENLNFVNILPLCLRKIDTNTDLICKESTSIRCLNDLSNHLSSSTGKPINVKINYHGYLSGNEDENDEMKHERHKRRKKPLTKCAATGNKRPIKKRKLSNASTTTESDDISIYSDSDIENFEDVTDSDLDAICVDETSKSLAKKKLFLHAKRKSHHSSGNNKGCCEKKQELQTKNLEKRMNYNKQDEIPEGKFMQKTQKYSKSRVNYMAEKENIQVLNENKYLQAESKMEKKIQEGILEEKIQIRDYSRKKSNNFMEKDNIQELDKNEGTKKEIEIETNIQEEILNEKIPKKKYSIKELNENEELNDTCNEIYTVGDTVLVRYYSRKTWKYYAGVIENINISVDKLYDISFFKTINNKGNLKFRKQLRLDVDTVPESSIVKKIELLQISENPYYEVVLFDDDDLVYFT